VGSDITGNACESSTGKDCYPIVNGKASDGKLTGTYSWFENNKTETVTLDLTLSTDGKTLTGKYNVTKCNCTLNATLAKQ
jgi:hypothetical protein